MAETETIRDRAEKLAGEIHGMFVSNRLAVARGATALTIEAALRAEREACAAAVEGTEHTRDWVPGSLYDTLRREAAASIRARP